MPTKATRMQPSKTANPFKTGALLTSAIVNKYERGWTALLEKFGLMKKVTREYVNGAWVLSLDGEPKPLLTIKGEPLREFGNFNIKSADLIIGRFGKTEKTEERKRA